ncbi:MAG: Rad2 nuclease [Peltula sp. TS41687]|nr:MAG: Rad2 nuclease [Peltula sp. TS41687]
MGITGLLPLLKSIQRTCILKVFAGQTIGVDAYGWLHKGAIACAVDLALGRHTTKFVEYAMHRVRMLQHFGVVPFLVFDGDYLPSKAPTEALRASKREQSKRLGLELLQRGKTAQAYQELQKAIDVTPEMAGQLIEELRREGVKFIVAPYEADAQLAYLERKGVISGVISEDSDLLVFGVNCLITKLDQYGECIVINRADFTACTDISLVGWSDAEFRQMAILSGCDYLANINQMGLKTAYRLVRKHKTVNRIVQVVQFEGPFKVPAGYLESFKRAELTFKHQRVFCPKKNKLVMFTDPEEDLEEEDLSFLGRDIKPAVAVGVANGELHPMTKEPLPRNLSGRRTPSGSGMSHATSGGSNSLKRGKPIQEFFKARRTPLAELDPNSFAPSSSQRQLLDQHSNASWTTISAPSTMVSNNMTPRSTSHRVPGMFDDDPTSLPTTRPSKRPRLCSDERPTNTSGQKTEFVKSRFFAKTLPPTDVKRNKHTKKSEINIFSDDSVEDAMSRLPDDFTPIKSGRTPDFKVFVDTSDVRSPSTTLVLPASTTAVQNTTGRRGVLTLANGMDKPHTALDEPAGPRDSVRPSSDTPQEPRLVQENVSTARKATSSLSNERALSKKTANAGPSTKRSTTLQRIGAMALKRSGLSSLRKSISASRTDTSSTDLEAQDDLNELLTIDTEITKQTVVISAPGPESLLGSEDLIIPDSEEEEEDDDFLLPIVGFGVEEALHLEDVHHTHQA